MNTLNAHPAFSAWLEALADAIGKAHVLNRLNRARAGNFGDVAPVGDGVSEMRIHYGPGYRIYFTRVGGVVYLLLAGGDKSTQAEDIRLAKSRVPPKPRSPTRDGAKRTKGK